MTTTGGPREIFDAHTVTPEQQAYALDRAINGLRDDDPRQSASKPLLGWQKPVLLSLLAVLIALAVLWPEQTAVGLIGFCTLAYLLTLGDRVLIFRRGLASRPIVVPDEVARAIPDDELPAYTILVPAYNEPEVVGRPHRRDGFAGLSAGKPAGAAAVGGRRPGDHRRGEGVR